MEIPTVGLKVLPGMGLGSALYRERHDHDRQQHFFNSSRESKITLSSFFGTGEAHISGIRIHST